VHKIDFVRSVSDSVSDPDPGRQKKDPKIIEEVKNFMF
jgi:hypothetical protein